MNRASRREFFRQGIFGLAAMGTGGLVLHERATATPGSGSLGGYARYVEPLPPGCPLCAAASAPGQPKEWKATEDNILGPYYRTGSPYRAKITPLLEPGTPLLIRGRVWALDVRKPLAGAVIDIWQANAAGRYDNDDPSSPPKPDVFMNRARLLTDEEGRYEYETVHPGAYKIGPNAWRPCHIHYIVRAQGYKQLITQLYFKGDPHNKTDPFIKDALIVDVVKRKVQATPVEEGVFDIVLARA